MLTCDVVRINVFYFTSHLMRSLEKFSRLLTATCMYTVHSTVLYCSSDSLDWRYVFAYFVLGPWGWLL